MQIIVWALFIWFAVSISIMLLIMRFATQIEYWETRRDKLVRQWALQQQKDGRDLRGD